VAHSLHHLPKTPFQVRTIHLMVVEEVLEKKKDIHLMLILILPHILKNILMINSLMTKTIPGQMNCLNMELMIIMEKKEMMLNMVMKIAQYVED